MRTIGSDSGGLDEPVAAPKAAGNQVDTLSEALYDHHVKPYAESTTMRKISGAIHHTLTCGNLSHMHGVIKVSWDDNYQGTNLTTDSSEPTQGELESPREES